jgi:hypothetical protein
MLVHTAPGPGRPIDLHLRQHGARAHGRAPHHAQRGMAEGWTQLV